MPDSREVLEIRQCYGGERNLPHVAAEGRGGVFGQKFANGGNGNEGGHEGAGGDCAGNLGEARGGGHCEIAPVLLRERECHAGMMSEE